MDRLTLMETFVCTVETGSFSAAARLLNVGQPAVSKAIAQLEERLQTRLLLRSTRGLTTTEAGQAYYESAKRAIGIVNQADDAARGVSAELVGKLRVCAAVTFARLHIIPHIKQFLAQHPMLEVEVMLDDRQIDLLEHGIDVALRMGNLDDSSMTARKIATARRLVVAAPAYLAEHSVPEIPADLAQHEAVVYLADAGGAATWSFERGSTKVSVTVHGHLRVNAAEGVRAAVCSGVGVAIASEWMFAPELANGAVEQLLPEWSLPTIDLWAVYPSGRLASAKARAFTAFVQEIMAGAASKTAVLLRKE
ncbi:LysR family transcriptional regulator [Pseudoduganella sp. FT55W]|uniref:LysR family transcriptional regulator n=1 Tax=Duganella rivi TaxID=2666083 RepID=A0A7X4GTX7_9BURK|nr:LysR family transcriptional regulator [Duganella rivi]MYM69513.1 LysR family transcriptional regulator [Duganella rivi]